MLLFVVREVRLGYKVTRIRPQSSSSTVGLLKKNSKNLIESLTVAPQKLGYIAVSDD